MRITIDADGEAAIVAPAGLIDTRASSEFEKQIVELLQQGKRRFVIDFTKVDLITSAGIRVLVMLTRRLRGVAGHVTLCKLNEQVKTVFEIAGLNDQFAIYDSRKDALKGLADPATPPSAGDKDERQGKLSKVSQVLRRLLETPDDGAHREATARSHKGGRSQLSSQVAELLRTEQDKPNKGGR